MCVCGSVAFLRGSNIVVAQSIGPSQAPSQSSSRVVLRRQVAVCDLGLVSSNVCPATRGSIDVGRSHFGSVGCRPSSVVGKVSRLGCGSAVSRSQVVRSSELPGPPTLRRTNGVVGTDRSIAVSGALLVPGSTGIAAVVAKSQPRASYSGLSIPVGSQTERSIAVAVAWPGGVSQHVDVYQNGTVVSPLAGGGGLGNRVKHQVSSIFLAGGHASGRCFRGVVGDVVCVSTELADPFMDGCIGACSGAGLDSCHSVGHVGDVQGAVGVSSMGIRTVGGGVSDQCAKGDGGCDGDDVGACGGSAVAGCERDGPVDVSAIVHT